MREPRAMDEKIEGKPLPLINWYDKPVLRQRFGSWKLRSRPMAIECRWRGFSLYRFSIILYTPHTVYILNHKDLDEGIGRGRHIATLVYRPLVKRWNIALLRWGKPWNPIHGML